jgi:hypothetical protein
MKKIISVIFFVMLVFISGCYYDKEELLYPNGNDCSGIAATYSGAIQGIIQTSCALGSTCHGAGSTNGPGQLTSYNEVKAAAAQVRSSVVTGIMPKGMTLPAEDIKAIRCWVDGGAPNN